MRVAREALPTDGDKAGHPNPRLVSNQPRPLVTSVTAWKHSFLTRCMEHSPELS